MAPELYDTSTYDNLPCLSDAGKVFDAKNGEDMISSKFRELFLHHKVDRIFGLALLHRHFELSPNEQLVEYRGTSVPWEYAPGAISPYIRPTNWALVQNGSFLPYEFHYSIDEGDVEFDEPGNPTYLPFLQDFERVLHEEDAVGLFGLCKYPGDNFPGRVEITQGRANINLLPQHV